MTRFEYFRPLLLWSMLSASASLSASETTTYGYDVLGRLVTVSTAGGPNAGVHASTTFDAAGNRSNYAVIGSSGGGTANLSVSDAAVTEGNNLVFTVTRGGVTTTAVNANYTTDDGAAIAGSDYTAVSGTVSFAPGETIKTIIVGTIDDTSAENSESMSLNLSIPSVGATLLDAQGLGRIIDNDSSGTANHAPVAGDDVIDPAFRFAQLVPVLANDSDSDGDTLTVTGVAGAYFVVGPQGGVRFSPPFNIAAGTYLGTYTISDGRGGTASANIRMVIR